MIDNGSDPNRSLDWTPSPTCPTGVHPTLAAALSEPPTAFWEDVVKAGVKWRDISALDPAEFLPRCKTETGGCVTLEILARDLPDLRADQFLRSWGVLLEAWSARLLRLTWQRLQACGLCLATIRALKFDYVAWLEILSSGDDTFVVEEWLDAMGIDDDEFYELQWFSQLPAAMARLPAALAHTSAMYTLKL